MIYLILVFGFLIRLVSLNQSLWLDEGTTGLVSRISYLDILNKFSPGDFHPPLYYLFINYWENLFGSSEISLRLPSVLFSLGTIFLIYKLWQELVNEKDAWITALFLATSGLFVYYSQEARMYMFSAFLVALSIFSFARLDSRSARQVKIGDWVLFSISITLLSFSDYLPNLIIPIFWILTFNMRENSTWIKKYFMSHIILVLGWVWWLPTFTKQLNSGFNVSTLSPAWWEILGKFSIKNLALIPVKFIIGRIDISLNWQHIALIICLVSIFGYLIIKSLKSFKKTKIVYYWLFIPILFTVLISFKLSVLSYFRLLFVLPSFYFLIALGIINLKKPWKNAAIIFVLVANLITSGIYLFNPKFHRENWRDLVKDSKNKTVVFPSQSHKEAFLYYAGSDISWQSLKGDEKEIWLVRYIWQISDPNDSARQKIESLGYKKQEELDYNGVPVWRYTR